MTEKCLTFPSVFWKRQVTVDIQILLYSLIWIYFQTNDSKMCMAVINSGDISKFQNLIDFVEALANYL